LKGFIMTESDNSDLPDQTKEGLWLLQHPVLPLFRMVQFLFLTGQFDRVEQIVEQFIEPIETSIAKYDDPAALLTPYLPVMEGIETLKKKEGQAIPFIVDEQNNPVNRFTAMESWVGQQILTMELEKINSLLCGPCNCVLCCVGPDYGTTPDAAHQMEQEFFEIPLTGEEAALFDLPRIDNEQTRSVTANTEPPLQSAGRPFYEQGGPAIYNWQNGWTMILPRKSRCPQLEGRKHTCRIYPQRPAVCRRPQIFPYLIEKSDAAPGDNHGAADVVHVARNKLLAVWDCPYVREFKQEIAAYAEACRLEPVFMENKA
jgi:Fe-S-cluster containining protein